MNHHTTKKKEVEKDEQGNETVRVEVKNEEAKSDQEEAGTNTL